ncbi:COG1470 family protein [Streptomyces sp. NPDC054834]
MPSATRVRRPALPAVSLLSLLAVATPASAADGWTLAPLGGDRPSVYAEGAPGAVLRDTVSVTNRGHKPLAVRLTGTGTGVQVAFARTRVRVPARTRADVPFTVTVPAGTAPGERAGTIVARDGDGRTAAVDVRLRTVGPALSALTVEHVAVRGDRISYELVNRGTTALVPMLAVRADGLFGRRVLDRAPRSLPVRLSPGERLRLDEPWPGRPALDAVEVRLTVTASGGAHATAGTSARFVPWGALAGTAGAVAAGAVAVVVRRRGRRTPEAEPLAEPLAESLAEPSVGLPIEPPVGQARSTGAVR